MSTIRDCTQIFTELGLSASESQIYVYLLQHSPATGYRIAKDTGGSFSNVYKTLSALQDRGVIDADEGATRLFRAVPVEELLDRIERRFRDNRRRAIEAARQLPNLTADIRIYQLNSVDQVYERCRKMLAECEERALLELFPGPLAKLRPLLEDTAARGADITVRAYEQAEIEGVRVIVSPFAAENLDTFHSQWMGVFVDGRQYLLGLLSPDEQVVYHAIWNASPLLAWSVYGYVNSDLHHYAFRTLLETATDLEELRRDYARLQDSFPVGADLGFRELMTRVRSEWQDDSAPTVEESS